MRLFLSPRLIVFITLAIALSISKSGYIAVFGTLIGFQQLIILILVFSAVALSLSAFHSFDIESKREFVIDIIMDVISLCSAIAMMVYLMTLEINFSVSKDAVVLSVLAIGLAVLDFLISLNGGSGKLLEMDREHFTRE